jgi:hypothetical protein
METEINTSVGESARGCTAGSALARDARPKHERVAPYRRLADENRGTGGHMPRSEAAHGFEISNDKLDNCEKIVLRA